MLFINDVLFIYYV